MHTTFSLSQKKPVMQQLLTFITEWGRYRYLRGPQGFKASGDAYTKAYYDLTMDIPRKVQCVDDTLLWDKDIEESFYMAHCWITSPIALKMELSSTQRKFRFSQTEIDFVGFHVTKDGIKPATSLLDAISSFPQAHQHQRCSLMVWPSKSVCLWTFLIKSYAALP